MLSRYTRINYFDKCAFLLSDHYSNAHAYCALNYLRLQACYLLSLIVLFYCIRKRGLMYVDMRRTVNYYGAS